MKNELTKLQETYNLEMKQLSEKNEQLQSQFTDSEKSKAQVFFSFF